MADRKYGVIGIRYREVPCDYCPDNEAQLPAGQSASTPVQAAPSGWSPSLDKRPSAKMCGHGSSNNGKQSSPRPGQQSSPIDQAQQQGSQSADSQSSKQPLSLQSGGESAPQPSSSIDLGRLFGSNSFLKDFQDISYNIRNSWTVERPDGQISYCGILDGWGKASWRCPCMSLQPIQLITSIALVA
jgi:hypothetical protein